MCPLTNGQSGTGSPGKASQLPEWGGGPLLLVPGPARNKAPGASKAPLVTLHGPSPRGSLGTHPGSHFTPVVVPSWEQNSRPLLSSLEGPGEGAVTTGVMVAQGLSLCGQEGDLSGGD